MLQSSRATLKGYCKVGVWERSRGFSPDNYPHFWTKIGANLMLCPLCDQILRRLVFFLTKIDRINSVTCQVMVSPRSKGSVAVAEARLIHQNPPFQRFSSCDRPSAGESGSNCTRFVGNCQGFSRRPRSQDRLKP